MIERLDQWFFKLATGMAWLSGILYFGLAFFIFFDVVSRKFFGVSTGSTIEISSLTAVVAASGAFAYCLFMDSHITIDTLSARYNPALQRRLRVVTFLALSFLAGMFAYNSWLLAMDSLEFNVTTSIGNLPVAYSQFYMAFGLTVFCLSAAIRALRIWIIGDVTAPQTEGDDE